jgi:hypothetical protein
MPGDSAPDRQNAVAIGHTSALPKLASTAVVDRTLRKRPRATKLRHTEHSDTDAGVATNPALLSQPDIISSSSLDTLSFNDDNQLSSLTALRRTENPTREADSDHSYGIDLALLLKPLPDYLQDSSVRRLLDHYDHSVAATMVWVDSHENPWRNIMLPLAIESPPLLLSMLALSAEHLAARMRSSRVETCNEPILSRKYRDKSLELLARQVRDEVRTGSKVGLIRRGPVNSTLATMLM